ncbi:HAD family hydrolase [Amycolatopsis anabasis]|uniref:HAD family hydrolase n=1 Tax=Amycolatopsis anabasis TaxID=1840409 RepID=UPI001FE4357B|nr:HAD family phosphatase [Amycolatopsis anabasis]
MAEAERFLPEFRGRPGKEVLAGHLALFPGRSVDELFAEAVAYSRRPDVPAARPVRGAVELIERLHGEGVPIGVVTSGTRDYAHAELSALGVLARFAVVLTADDVTRGKPDPEGYLAGCAALGVEPEHTVVFEDAPAGIAAAKRAGAWCVAVTTTMPRSALTAADLVLADLSEVEWPVAAAAPFGR